MIVPQTKLLFWFAIVVLPFTVLAALHSEALVISLVAMAAMLAVAALDAARAFGRLDGITLELPEVVRVSKDRSSILEIKIKNERQKPLRVRLGLSLPPEIQSPQEDLFVDLPAGSEWSRLEWPCTPRHRGHYRLHRACLETISPFGLWARRTLAPIPCELRVYPNLMAERSNLAAIFLHRGAFGLHAQRQLGKGREFEKLREYVPGDSFDEIHWKATAKRSHPVTKVYQIERTQEVYVILDASRLSARRVEQAENEPARRKPAPAPGEARQNRDGVDLFAPLTLERFIMAGLLLGLAAEKQGDLFGLLTFSDKVETFVRAKSGRAHYDACRDALYTLQPRPVTPDFDEVASFIRLRLRRRALLVFLTSLDDPVLAEGFVRNMNLLCRQHLVLVNMMKPAGADPVFTHGNVHSTDDLYRHLGGHLQWHNLRELEKVLQRRGVQFSLLENEKMAAQLVSQYVGVKQRQLL